MHAPLPREQFNGALIFDNAQDMLDAMSGPQQHDYHVACRDRHLRNKAMLAGYDKANEAVAEHVRVMIARMHAGRSV